MLLLLITIITRIADKSKYFLERFSKINCTALGSDSGFMGTSLFSQKLKNGISVQLTM